MNNVVLSEFPITTIQSDRTTMNSVLVAAIDTDHVVPGKIVGTVQVTEVDGKNPSACIMSLCVDTQYRRKGLGKALTIRAIDVALREWSACESIWLSTSKDNREAIALYNALGFVETGPYKANGIYMQKELRQDGVVVYDIAFSTGPQHLTLDPEGGETVCHELTRSSSS